MKKDVQLLILVTVLGLTAVGSSYLFAVFRRDGEHPEPMTYAPALVSIRRIEPVPSDSEDVIQTLPNSLVKCVFRIRNDSSQTLRDLSLPSKCNCQDTQPLREKLSPNEYADIVFTTRAADAGKIKQHVPVLAAGQVVATLDLAIRSLSVIPILQPPPAMRTVTFIKGDSSSHVLAFRTVERRDHAPWIRGIELLTEGVIRVGLPEVNDTNHPDPELIRRTYKVAVSVEDVPVGKYEVRFQFMSSEKKDAPDGVFVWGVEILESLVLFPEELKFELGGSQLRSPKRVKVVRRFGSEQVVVEDYDSSLLEVLPETNANGEVVALAVTPLIRQIQDSFDTSIVLRIADQKRLMIGVELQPSSISK